MDAARTLVTTAFLAALGTAVLTTAQASESQAGATGLSRASQQTQLMHVDSIEVTTNRTRGRNVLGVAVVVIVDADGQPVSSATVTGSFTGDVNETVSGRTTFGGQVVLVTSTDARSRDGFTFCVEELTHFTFEHDAAADVETCDSTAGSGGGGGGRGGGPRGPRR